MQIAVVGAGAMGRGIAQVSAASGYDVLLYDVAPGAAAGALDSISAGLQEAVRRGKLTSAEADTARARVVARESLADLNGADLVIEAVVEDLPVKQAIFEELETIVDPETILASNTSSLAIGAVAATMQDRGRLIGLHFFNPVPAMRLVEIVVRKSTASSVQSKAQEWVASIGKTGVVVADSPGFLVNYAGRAFVTEALHITRDSVATVAEVDRIAVDVLGFKLGPFQLMDLTGMDVNFPVTDNLFAQNFGEPRLASTWEHRYLLETGDLGRKTGAGFYSYTDERLQSPSPTGLPAAEGAPAPKVAVVGTDRLECLIRSTELERVDVAGADLILVDPLGDDLVTHAERTGLDPLRLVGVDLFIPDPAVFTVMAGPGVDLQHVAGFVAELHRLNPVVLVNDSPGFIAQRLVSAIINLGCDIAQRGIASPRDIDKAVTLGLRYPYGPLEWADRVGLARVVEISQRIHQATENPRYRPSAWLRRRALAGLSCTQGDLI